MNRLYAIEGRHDHTGSVADHRVRVKPVADRSLARQIRGRRLSAAEAV
jgi:hypothetical protein